MVFTNDDSLRPASFSDADLKRLKDSVWPYPIAILSKEALEALLARLEAAEKLCAYTIIVGNCWYSRPEYMWRELVSLIEAWLKAAGK